MDGSADALARVQTAARRAGGAWNRHDASSLRDALMVARELGLPDVKLEYGGLRFRFDLQPGGAATCAVAGQRQAGGDGERLDEGVPSGAPAPPPARTADASAAATPAQFADTAHDTAHASASDHARLLAKEAVAQERRRRQKAARKAREATVRETASKYAALSYGDVDTPTKQVRCELWSTTVDLKMAVTKLVGEVTQRCAAESGRAGLSTKACNILFAGRTHEMTVLSGTAALEMTATERTLDLLVMLNYGLTEERLAALLRRWSKRAAPAREG